LNEHVAVFDRRFRIIQDIAVDASRDAETALAGKADIHVTAALEYQACDNKVCFNPASLPLSWTLHLRTLDRERVRQ